MPSQNENIVDLLRKKAALAVLGSGRGLILQPGSIGDCILTLPLAKFMKDSVTRPGVDILGHSEYIGILPGRTCVDGIRSIDSIELHRLFADTKTFNLADRDPLINTFTDYSWIVSFLGEPNSSFEQNLIYTAHCSHSAEVITLPLKPPADFTGHLTDFYSRQFVDQSGIEFEGQSIHCDECLIKATKADTNKGRELLKESDIDPDKKLVVIQPGSGGKQKSWHLENFLAIAQELLSKDIEVIFLLGPAELDRFSNGAIKNIRSVSRCLTDLSLTEVLGLLSCANTYLGNDSGITHLAATSGIRTLAVFGPTDPAVYKPIGPDVIVFTNKTAQFANKPTAKMQQEVLKVLTVLL